MKTTTKLIICIILATLAAYILRTASVDMGQNMKAGIEAGANKRQTQIDRMFK